MSRANGGNYSAPRQPRPSAPKAVAKPMVSVKAVSKPMTVSKPGPPASRPSGGNRSRGNGA